MGKGKLPKAAIPGIVETAEFESKYTKKPAADILKHYFQLMDKYRDYFFDAPWPKEYNFQYATTFTQTDLDFLAAGYGKDFGDRIETMCIKKNLYQTGFMSFGKSMWTFKAFEKYVTEEARKEREAAQKCPVDSQKREHHSEQSAC